MSLDVYLEDPTATYETQELYWANITHNLAKMASEAGIYQAIWRPEEIGAENAKDIIDLVDSGLQLLKNKPEYFKNFNSPNGWGMYKHFVPFVEKYLDALTEYPESKIRVSR